MLFFYSTKRKRIHTDNFRTRKLFVGSPRTKLIASIRFDLPGKNNMNENNESWKAEVFFNKPEPLGPIIAVNFRNGPITM